MILVSVTRAFGSTGDPTPVVFITAHDDPEVRAQAEACACVGHFRKTDAGADVLAAIRRAISDEDSERAKLLERT